MTEINFTKDSNSSTVMLRELCAMHPNDPIFHVQLAEKLMQTNHEIMAIFAARTAYRILLKSNPNEAKSLEDRFGIEVTTDDMKPLVCNDYLPLAKIFGVFALNRKKLRIKEGSILLRRGEPADFIYLILEGELAISSEINGKLSLLNYLHAGALVGEGALQAHAKRSATIIAHTKATLLRFKPEELKQAFAKHPELHLQFSKESILRQRVAHISAAESFACLPIDLRFMAAKRAWNSSYAAGHIIKKSNEHMPRIELITNGMVHLYEDSENNVPTYCGRFEPGDILGLHKIMDGGASKLTFIAETHCDVICMEFETLEDIMEISSDFRQKVRDTAAHLSTHITRTMMLQKTSEHQSYPDLAN